MTRKLLQKENSNSTFAFFFLYLYPTSRTFFRIQIILPQIPLVQTPDASGLAGKIFLAKPAAATALHTPD
jgi:hypothetical protein